MIFSDSLATLSFGRLPEWTNGAASKAVVALCVTVGSNPTPSAKVNSVLPVFSLGLDRLLLKLYQLCVVPFPQLQELNCQQDSP